MATKYLGVCSGLGAQLFACEKGPRALFPEIELLYPQNEGAVLARIHELNVQLADGVTKILQKNLFPVVLGGDHSIAVGTWNGVQRAIEGSLGLIWIDAHMDGHTCETTPSGAFHGMPLAGLLGFGDPKMAKLLKNEPVLKPENLVLIGVRSFEEGEAALFEKLNIKIYFIDEVKRRGLHTVVQEAIASLKTSHLGLSLDLDSIDPIEAPGVGSPAPDGLSSKELLAVLPVFKNRLVAFELVEYNPDLDFQDKTKKLAYQILETLVGSTTIF